MENKDAKLMERRFYTIVDPNADDHSYLIEVPTACEDFFDWLQGEGIISDEATMTLTDIKKPDFKI